MLTEIELVDEIKFHINAGLLDVKQHFKGKFPQKHLDVVLSAGEEERELFRCLGEDVIRGCLTDIIFDAFPTVQSKNTLTKGRQSFTPEAITRLSSILYPFEVSEVTAHDLFYMVVGCWSWDNVEVAPFEVSEWLGKILKALLFGTRVILRLDEVPYENDIAYRAREDENLVDDYLDILDGVAPSAPSMKLKWTQFDGELVIDPEGLKTTDKAPQTSGDTNRNKENELPISL